MTTEEKKGYLTVKNYSPAQQKLLDQYYRSLTNLSSASLRPAPKDKYNFVYLVSNLLGVGTLLAYNVIITSSDYLLKHFDASITFWIVPVYVSPSLTFLLLMIRFGERFRFTTRLVASFLSTALLLMIFPILLSILPTTAGYAAVLLLSAWVGVTSSIVQGTALGFTALLDSKYAQSCISGQAVAGIIACVIRFATKGAMPSTTKGVNQGGLIYYILGGVGNIICTILFLIAFRSPFVRHRLSEYFVRWYRQQLKRMGIDEVEDQISSTDSYTPQKVGRVNGADQTDTNKTVTVQKKKKPKKENGDSYVLLPDGNEEEEEEEEDELDQTDSLQISNNNNNNNNTITNSLTAPKTDINGDHSIDKTLNESAFNKSSVEKNQLKTALLDKTTSNFIDVPEEIKAQQEKVSYSQVFMKIRPLAAAVFLVLFITFLMFPGLTVGIESQYGTVNAGDWMSVILVTLYNIGDYFGRQFLASWTAFGLTPRTLWLGCLWRIWLYPLFLAMYQGWLQNDIVAYVAMLTMSISNGHFCCLCFIWVNQMVQPYEQEVTANIMSFALVSGIAAGSFLALAISALL